MNRTIMAGRLVETPELQKTGGGISVCRFRLAVDRPYLVNGERKADFFDVIAWRQSAEFVCKYFTKGKFIIVEGHFETRSYDDRQNVRRRAVELIVDHLEFGGDGKKDGGRGLPEPPPESGGQAAPQASVGQGALSPSADYSEVAVDSDDLPF